MQSYLPPLAQSTRPPLPSKSCDKNTDLHSRLSWAQFSHIRFTYLSEESPSVRQVFYNKAVPRYPSKVLPPGPPPRPYLEVSRSWEQNKLATHSPLVRGEPPRSATPIARRKRILTFHILSACPPSRF